MAAVVAAVVAVMIATAFAGGPDGVAHRLGGPVGPAELLGDLLGPPLDLLGPRGDRAVSMAHG